MVGRSADRDAVRSVRWSGCIGAILAIDGAQAYAYACGLPPNGAVNGVWLRGYKLKYGTSGYANLTEAQKKRAYHPRTFRISYGQWIKDELRPYVNADGECINQSGLWSKVRWLWGALRLGQTESD